MVSHDLLQSYAPVICIHCSPPTRMGRDSDFSLFQSPGINPALWGQADGNKPTLSPILHYRKTHRGKFPNVLTLAFPWHWGDNQKVLALHHSPAIPPLSPYVGGAWIQMTGALTVQLIVFYSS